MENPPQIKTNYCIFPLCSRPVERNEFCFLHAKHFAGPKPDKVKPPIAKQSPKRKKEQKVYVRIVKRKLKENELCQVKAEGCKGKATGLHHPLKRSPATWLNESELIPCCDPCNLWIELNPEKAIELGFSKSKFTPVVVFDEVNGVKVAVADRV